MRFVPIYMAVLIQDLNFIESIEFEGRRNATFVNCEIEVDV